MGRLEGIYHHVQGMLRLSCLLAGLLIGALTACPGHADDRMELHLLLAFDVSASVNDEEFALQRAGTASAFRAASVGDAIMLAPGGIAVSIVQWSSLSQQALGLDWVTLTNATEAAAFADTVDAMPRRLPGGGTMIHAGLDFAARQLATAPGSARRRVVDLSGNGRADDEKQMIEARDRLLSRGVVINGLAIEEDYDDLTRYFHSFVIGGPGAFVVTANDFDDFHEAMETKLHREITGPSLSMRRTGTIRHARASK